LAFKRTIAFVEWREERQPYGSDLRINEGKDVGKIVLYLKGERNDSLKVDI
jgi:hypothetical protein